MSRINFKAEGKTLEQIIKSYYDDINGIHHAAGLMPAPSEEDYERLKSDIKQNGLLRPITINGDGELIDGRSRLLACFEVGQDIRLEVYKEDPISFVISSNMALRHLTTTQKAKIGLDIEKMRAAEARKRQSKARKGQSDQVPGEGPGTLSKKGAAAEQAAEEVGVSASTIKRLKFVMETSDDLAKEVENEEISIKSAYSKLKSIKFNDSKIDWCDFTWNPVTGCKQGCVYCYARNIAKRFSDVFPKGFEPHFRSERLLAPKNMGKPKSGYDKVFVCSMADLFGKWIPDSWIEKVMEACNKRPEWTYIFLTKNPSRLQKIEFPKNSWVGVTVDCQKMLKPALQALKKLNVPVCFISFEPLVEPIDVSSVNKNIDWAIIGPETGDRIDCYDPSITEIAGMANKMKENIPVFLKDAVLDCHLTQNYPLITQEEK